MIENDKSIFDYLKIDSNDMLSKLDVYDMDKVLFYLNKYYLEYRDKLNLGNSDTFGIEVEVEHFVGWNGVGFSSVLNKLNTIVENIEWDIKNDITLNHGGEFISSILKDEECTWRDIKKSLSFISLNGDIDYNCAAHVHAGCQILGDNVLYWYRFLKLWSAYENIIYRFCYGEYLSYRPYVCTFARPSALFFQQRLSLLDNKLDYDVKEMLNTIEPKGYSPRYTKRNGLSYWKLLLDKNYNEYENYNEIVKDCTWELRVPNGTLDEVIWQNNINFFIKMMHYCKSDRYNDEIINKRLLKVENISSNISTYSLIYMEQVLEFIDMIFDNNLDKIYFLRQYLKDMDYSKNYIKTRKFTNSER